MMYIQDETLFPLVPDEMRRIENWLKFTWWNTLLLILFGINRNREL